MCGGRGKGEDALGSGYSLGVQILSFRPSLPGVGCLPAQVAARVAIQAAGSWDRGRIRTRVSRPGQTGGEDVLGKTEASLSLGPRQRKYCFRSRYLLHEAGVQVAWQDRVSRVTYWA